MTRVTCAVLGLAAFAAAPPPPDVDAVTFVTAFRAGQAEQFKNRQVSGTAVSFHGAIRERVADGSERTSLVVTIAAALPDGRTTPIRTWEDFVSAERDRSTLVIALSGANLPQPPAAQRPVSVEFSGVYDGQVRTIARVPQAGESTTADSGPCPGEQPQPPDAKGSFYCAPLLTSATATIK